MKARFSTLGNKLHIEVEGENEAELFEQIATAQEAFTHEQCGFADCKNPSLKFVVRTDDEENKYYELHCTNLKCRARLPFGQAKKPKGKLYPKRRVDQLSDKDKENRGLTANSPPYLPSNGWYRYVPKAKEENSSAKAK